MSVNLGRIKSGPNYKAYIIFFGVISIAVIAFVIHISFAKATITIYPTKDTTRGSTNINVSSQATGNLAAFNAVKGTIMQKKGTTTKTFSGVEKKEVDSYAKGVVTLHNERSEEQPLLSGTQLISDKGILYKTQKRVVILANGMVNVDVVAAEKGAVGNSEPTHFIIAKLWENWQNVIYGESSEALSGGRVDDYVIDESSFKKAETDILNQIKADTLSEITPTLQENERITADSIQIEITKFTPLAKDGDISESFDTTVSFETTAVLFNDSLIKDIAEEKIKGQLNESKEIISLDSESFEYSLKSVGAEKKSAVLEVSIAAKTIHKISSKALEKKNLIGRTHGDLVTYYNQFSEVQKVDVSYFPFWVQNVPTNEGNIEILVK